MRIVIGIHSLAAQGGTESWVTTIGDHLQRVGHDVWIYSAEGGVTAGLAESLGLRTVLNARDLPDDVDVALVQDVVSALELAAWDANTPQVFISHSDIFDVQLTPQLPDVTACIVTLYDRAEERVLSQALTAPVRRLKQPVDVQRFRPTRPIAAEPRVAIALGNYLAGERREIIRTACELAGIEFRQVGATASGATTTPERTINEADIVIGKAKVIHEAMACGRAAYVFDVAGCEGWVTAESYDVLVGDNFAGRTRPRLFTTQQLAEDLRAYDPAMGIVNRDLMVAHHTAEMHTARLVDVIREFVPPREGAKRAERPELFELARLVRVNWRHEGNAYQLTRFNGELASNNAELRWELEQARALAQSAERKLNDVHHSLRWRVVQGVMRPFDRMRGRA